MNDLALELHDVRRTFLQGGRELPVLRGCSLAVARGTMVALIGPSGSGKSTFLHIAGLLERPDGGSVRVAGEEAGALNDAGRTALRRGKIGFVYQFHHLLPEFSAQENIMLPQLIAGRSVAEARRRAATLLAQVGLSERAGHRPAQLSGGEQQRVAIARALANSPSVLIADEPTGNLDPATAEQVFALLQNVARDAGIGFLMATHNHDLARRMDSVLELREGRVVGDRQG